MILLFIALGVLAYVATGLLLGSIVYRYVNAPWYAVRANLKTFTVGLSPTDIALYLVIWPIWCAIEVTVKYSRHRYI